MSAVAHLLDLLDEAFDRRGAWHGPNLWTTVRGVDWRHASARPAAGRHTIHELALHCAYWKHRVRARLDPRGAGRFLRSGRNFPDPPDPPSEEAWRDDLDLLAGSHRALRATAAGLAPATLDRPSRGHRQTPRRLLVGIACHDLYHAGQIRLLYRMIESEPGRGG